MIVHDPPPFRQVFENECEASVRLIVFALEPPAAKDDRRIRRKHGDLNVTKAERPHFRAIRIFLPVPLTHCFPTASDFVL